MQPALAERTGGIVLCGGKSRRMGSPKAWLPFGPELLLQRVVRILGEVVSPIVVVAAAGQQLPKLPHDVIMAYDEHEERGPLAGLAAGLSALRRRADAAYASSCDVPLLQPAFVRAMIERLATHELAIVREEKFYHPLAAVYRTKLVDDIEELIAAERLRPLFLLEKCDACEIDAEQLREVDPNLDSLRNTNTPQDYAAVLRDAGFKPPSKS